MDEKALELAYLAGFFDGEGSIYIVRGATKGTFRLQIGVYNIDPRPLLSLQKAFGGSVISLNRGKAKWRPYYQWIAIANKAEATITALLPYLKVKEEQAKLALTFREVQKQQWKGRKVGVGIRGFEPFTDVQIAKKQALREAIHILNTGGKVKTRYNP